MDGVVLFSQANRDFAQNMQQFNSNVESGFSLFDSGTLQK